MSTADVIALRPYPSTVRYRSEHPSIVSRIINKLAALQARREELRHITQLRQMDVHLLEDMGVDQVALWQPTPRLRCMDAQANAIIMVAPPVNCGRQSSVASRFLADAGHGIGSLANWLRLTIAAARTRHALRRKAEAVKYLDRKTLADIGLEPVYPGPNPIFLSTINPYAMVIQVLTSDRSGRDDWQRW